MAIDHKAAEAAKPRDKVHYLSDGKQLRLQIHPKGGKYWQRGYRLPCGKQSVFSLGVFPDVTVKTARAKAAVVSGLVGEGKDPSEFEIVMGKAGWVAQAKPTREEVAKAKSASITFKDYCEAFIEKKTGNGDDSWSPSTRNNMENSINLWLYQKPLESMPLSEITKADIKAALKRVEKKGSLRVLDKLLNALREMFDDAEDEGLVEINPTPRRKSFKSAKEQNYVMLDFDDRADFLAAVDAAPESKYHPSVHITKLAIKFQMLTMTRPGEVWNAEWSEIDRDECLWSIPANRMKQERGHLVPLSKQAMAIINELLSLTSDSRFIFPSVKDHDKPMSDNTVGVFLRKLGFKGITVNDDSKTRVVTAHGMRHMASTKLHGDQGEQEGSTKYDSLAIERQLSHADKNKVRGRYNKAAYLMQRKVMLQDFADEIMPHGIVSRSNPVSHQSASA